MRVKELIATIDDLLEALVIEYGSRKYATLVQCLHKDSPEVIECFDDGKGHSGAFTRETTPLDPDVFEEALEKRYLSGKLKPGYVSKIEFNLTRIGRDAHYARLHQIREAERRASEAKAIAEHVPEPNND